MYLKQKIGVKIILHKCRLTKYVESLHPEKLHPVYTRKRIYTLQDIKDRTIMQEVT